MIDIINGLGRFINDTTKAIMGTPTRQVIRPPPQSIKPANAPKAPCTNCGPNGQVAKPNNGVIFNAEKQNTSAMRRITPELEVNLRNTPYMNTSGLKFN